MSNEITVASGKSTVYQIKAATFRGQGFQKTKMDYERIKVQDEISKLTLIISDETIPLTEDEIMDINEQINVLLREKLHLEHEIRKETGINLVPTGSSRKDKFFGRAIEIQKKRELDEQQQINLAKRKTFQPQAIVVDSIEELLLSKTGPHAKSDPKTSRIKKTRFDDSD